MADYPSSAIGYFVIGVSPIGSFVVTRNTPGVTKTIPSYLYKEYEDDDDLQAFVSSYNAMAQRYVDWFNSINLPIYTGDQIYDGLLDWVAMGIYGMRRPTLSSTKYRIIGPYNTFGFNSGLALNTIRRPSKSIIYVTTDDIFKRILTWHFYKGDGKHFSIRWLKRRVQRFLDGVNGTSPNIDYTPQISVTFGPKGTATLTVVPTPQSIISSQILKVAIDSRVLEMPFQWQWVVNLGTKYVVNLDVPMGAARGRRIPGDYSTPLDFRAS